MPLYEYRCRECHSKYEYMQKASDPPKKKCPACGGPLSKVLSAPALQFKGQGWYITDYSKKSRGQDDKPADSAPKKKEPPVSKTENKASSASTSSPNKD